MARPGPGNGCRPTISSGSPSSRPTFRTSSLNSSRSGSIRANFIPGLSPPTLWCVLIVTDGPPVGDELSITSGYNVPWTRNFACVPADAVASSNTSMNVCPIARRFGILDTGQCGEESPGCIDRDELDSHVRLRRALDLLALVQAQQPGVDED